MESDETDKLKKKLRKPFRVVEFKLKRSRAKPSELNEEDKEELERSISDAARKNGIMYRCYSQRLMRIFEYKIETKKIPKDLDFQTVRKLVNIHTETRAMIIEVYRFYNRRSIKKALDLFERYKKYVNNLNDVEKNLVYGHYYESGLPLFFCEACNKEVLATWLEYGRPIGNLILPNPKDVDGDLQEERAVGISRIAGCVREGYFFQCPTCHGHEGVHFTDKSLTEKVNREDPPVLKKIAKQRKWLGLI